MAIQIIISGDHATDVLGELVTLSNALIGNTPSVPVQGTSGSIGFPDSEQPDVNNEDLSEFSSNHHSADVAKAEPKKRAPRRTKPVETVEIEKVEDSIGDLLADDKDEVITLDSLRALITATAKDKDGKDCPVKYATIRGVMRDAVPATQELKMSNIPAEKLEEVYYEIKAIGVM